uniref:Uncharacterized protein n=1 Tax=Tetraselmis chuii TaxID=63592 RepID=A0A7S1WZZ7_9CHLO|mmetsp:Transcript_16303/g.29038  ORF Transcript_16303/g.29038 Transcript_16303/m.29038 type:complete len:173 (+) Transcript_16303:303-821(+)
MLTLNDSWRPCGVSSLFLPTTRKFEEAIHGAAYVRGKQPHAQPARALTPTLLLDYRCHADGGRIGRRYPPPFQRLMQHLARSSARDVMQEYGFLDPANAEALRSRARSMLDLGFEHTLENANNGDRRYGWQPACCRMRLEKQRMLLQLPGTRTIQCAHPWEPIVHPRPRQDE